MTSTEVRAMVAEVERELEGDDELFVSEVARLLAHTRMSVAQFADVVDASAPTVRRWLSGRNLPYGVVRRAILLWIGTHGCSCYHAKRWRE